VLGLGHQLPDPVDGGVDHDFTLDAVHWEASLRLVVELKPKGYTSAGRIATFRLHDECYAANVRRA
jgi:hypothetical protein